MNVAGTINGDPLRSVALTRRAASGRHMPSDRNVSGAKHDAPGSLERRSPVSYLANSSATHVLHRLCRVLAGRSRS
jgi:hypothetical protein